VKPILDWSAYHEAGMGDAYADIPKEGGDFARAVALCINSRQCEMKGAGVMCPSFRVTDSEPLSTGGRVRMLKAFLNDELPLDAPELAEAMALCVACKGCKRECENSVDMAQIKTEYLAQRHLRDGVDRRTRLFASFSRLLYRYPSLKRWIGVRNGSPLLSYLGEKWLGIAARPMPQPADEVFEESDYKVAAVDGHEVVLFIDSFSRYYESAIAEAALNLLVRAGYRVQLLDKGQGERPLCCGRSYIAHGMVDEAKEEATRVIEALLPFAERGVQVIGLEPACLLAIRDDYRALGLGDAAETVAAHAVLLEEFVAKESKAGRMQLPLNPYPDDAPEILVHGHCHQKAVGAMKSMRKVLKMVPKLRFSIIESSCCGMAGSFGLEAEHAGISHDMAEAALLPALRAHPEASVVANGFSCREQIRTETGRKPQHLALLLQQMLSERTKGQ